jgi:uncharacterized membrane protein
VRWGRVVTGIVVAVIGVVVVVVALVISDGTTSVTAPAGSAWTITPTALTSVTASIHWSGGNATTRVWLITGTPTCTSPSGVVANGSGPNGSFAPTLSPGTTYSLYACSGATFQAGTFSMTVSGGLTILELVGFVVIAIGAVLVFFGVRAKSPKRLYEPGGSGAVVAGAYPGGKGVAPTDLSSRPVLPPPPTRVPPPGRTMQGCPSCGKTFPAGEYSACPACGKPL